MNRFTDSMKAALKTENYYSALLPAMPFPDICGDCTYHEDCDHNNHDGYESCRYCDHDH